jgi:predicted ribosome quality control (RQC) complex YloA/Tae2 family protein
LRLKYGEVFTRHLDEILALDDMLEDSHRMKNDLENQKKKFENKMKKQGKDFNRL